MNSLREMIEKELKSAEREISKIEMQIQHLNGRLGAYNDRAVMLQGFLKKIDVDFANCSCFPAEDAERLANIPTETEGEENV